MNDTIAINAATLHSPPVPIFWQEGGNGQTTYWGNGLWVLDIGTIGQGWIGQTASLGIANAAAHVDNMGGSMTTWGPDFAFAGTGPFHGLGAGEVHGGLNITALSHDLGWHIGELEFQPTDAAGAAMSLQTLLIVDYVAKI